LACGVEVVVIQLIHRAYYHLQTKGMKPPTPSSPLQKLCAIQDTVLGSGSLTP
ncbi:uncharacterized, partial [Tachysurus ichikawai]